MKYIMILWSQYDYPGPQRENTKWVILQNEYL